MFGDDATSPGVIPKRAVDRAVGRNLWLYDRYPTDRFPHAHGPWPMPLRAARRGRGNVQSPSTSPVVSDTDCNGVKRRHTVICRIVLLCRGCAASSDACKFELSLHVTCRINMLSLSSYLSHSYKCINYYIILYYYWVILQYNQIDRYKKFQISHRFTEKFSQ